MPQSYTHENINSIPHLPVYCSIYETYKQLSPSHWHNHIEILFPLSGTLSIAINEQEHILTKEQIFIVNANEIHSTKSTGSVKILLLQIPYDYLASFISDFELVRFQEAFEDSKLQNSMAYITMQQQLTAIARIFTQKEKGYEFAFMAQLHQLLHTLYLRFSVKLEKIEKEPKHIARLKDVLQYISEHYAEPISLQEASDLAALNPEYFCRAFKRCTGVTLLEYVNLIRLNHIYAELFSTNDSVTDILERNGFTNYKVFSRMFKAHYGTTPAALRESMNTSVTSYNQKMR